MNMCFHCKCLICFNNKKIKGQTKKIKELEDQIIRLMKFKTAIDKNLIIQK